jgi:membrane-associated phospholipid phosphatase
MPISDELYVPKPTQEEVKEEKKRQVKRFSRRLLIEIGLFLICLFFFVYIVRTVVLENKSTLDDWGWNLVAPFRSAPMTSFMQTITFMGSWYFLTPAYLLLIFYNLFYRKRRSLSLDIASIAVTSTLVMFTIKEIFKRERPLEPLLHEVPGFSFPSGHSFSSFTFFGLLVYIIADSKRLPAGLKWILGISCLLIAALIASSRVYLKVHYPSDVIGGFLLCVIWLGVSFVVLHRLRGKRFLEH